jgi:hypothetical protein
MNFGTKVRTIARIVASLNTAVYAVNASIVGLGFGWLTLAWTILTIALDFVVAFFTTYYNNDYTPEACRHTGEMRAEKMEKNGINGEYFYIDNELEEEDDENE